MLPSPVKLALTANHASTDKSIACHYGTAAAVRPVERRNMTYRWATDSVQRRSHANRQGYRPRWPNSGGPGLLLSRSWTPAV